MPYEPPPQLAELTLAELAEIAGGKNLPPLEKWTPKVCGDSLMVIKSDGRWLHRGEELRRPAMVKAFSRLLLCDADQQHWLITPDEKLAILVEDAAYQAVDVAKRNQTLIFRLNTDEIIIAGANHPLIAAGDCQTPAIYLVVHHGTRARINRSTWLQLVNLAEGDLTIRSQGKIFSLIPE